jgi:hypothetical protein
LARLPSKKVIWLVIILVVITIGLLWYIGARDKREKESRLAQYTKELLDKQKNIEAVAIKGLISNEPTATEIEKLPKMIVLTTATSSTEQLRTYGLALAKALKSLSLERKNEPQAVMEAIDKNDLSALRSVTESRIIHQVAVQNMAIITVPKELVDQHTKIINQLNFLVSLLKNMEKATDQPQIALNNSKSFISNYSTFLGLIDNLNKYFADKEIKFSPQEKIQIFVSFTQ